MLWEGERREENDNIVLQSKERVAKNSEVLWLLCDFVLREDVWTVNYFQDFKKPNLGSSSWSIHLDLSTYTYLEKRVNKYGMIRVCVFVCVSVYLYQFWEDIPLPTFQDFKKAQIYDPISGKSLFGGEDII